MALLALCVEVLLGYDAFGADVSTVYLWPY